MQQTQAVSNHLHEQSSSDGIVQQPSSDGTQGEVTRTCRHSHASLCFNARHSVRSFATRRRSFCRSRSRKRRPLLGPAAAMSTTNTASTTGEHWIGLRKLMNDSLMMMHQGFEEYSRLPLFPPPPTSSPQPLSPAPCTHCFPTFSPCPPLLFPLPLAPLPFALSIGPR